MLRKDRKGIIKCRQVFPLTFLFLSTPIHYRHPSTSPLIPLPLAGRISFCWLPLMPTDHVMHSAQPSSSNLLTHTDPHIAHSYGTRIRQNIIIKPSARLRNSPDPPIQLRKPKITAIPKTQQTAYANFPQFPPSGIVLHPDDANSKVFLAIGRSFLSVVRLRFDHLLSFI